MQLKISSVLQGLSDLGARRGPTCVRRCCGSSPTSMFIGSAIRPRKSANTPNSRCGCSRSTDLATRVDVARTFCALSVAAVARVCNASLDDLPEVVAELRTHPLLQPLRSRPNRACPKSTTALLTATPASRGGTPGSRRQRQSTRPSAANSTICFSPQRPKRGGLSYSIFPLSLPCQPHVTRITPDPAVGPHLEAAALTGNRDEFRRRLARALRIPREQARGLRATIWASRSSWRQGASGAARSALSHPDVSQSRGWPFGRARSRARRAL